jgi:hypothetical protein
MDRRAFETARADVMRTRQPYSSRELDAVAQELDYGLEQEGLRVLRVKKTGGSRAMLEATCIPETASPAETRSAVERAWLGHAAFNGEAHVVDEDEHQIGLAFVTWWEHPGGSYVTGRIVVDLGRGARR